MMQTEALQLTYQALWLVLVLSAPPVIVAALVGLLIAFLQAATQIQEQTFQYAVKFFAIVVTIFLTASLLGGTGLSAEPVVVAGGRHLEDAAHHADGERRRLAREDEIPHAHPLAKKAAAFFRTSCSSRSRSFSTRRRCSSASRVGRVPPPESAPLDSASRSFFQARI